MTDKQRAERIERLREQLAALVAANAPAGERLAVCKLIEEARGK